MMGQIEILEHLKDNPNKWFTSREISEDTGMSSPSIGSAIRRLRHSREIKFKVIRTSNLNIPVYHYKHKRSKWDKQK